MMFLLFFACGTADKTSQSLEASIKKYFNEQDTENKVLQVYQFKINHYNRTNIFAADSIQLTALKWQHENLFYKAVELEDQCTAKKKELNMATTNSSDLSGVPGSL